MQRLLHNSKTGKSFKIGFKFAVVIAAVGIT
jgi:hypothetical protein